jgi:hypothetical protein
MSESKIIIDDSSVSVSLGDSGPQGPQGAGGAAGGGSDQVFYNNDQVVSTSYSIPSGKSSMAVGPVTVNSGVTVTIPTNSVWSII